jgi:NIMA (never in mitosis gene a)-related kinase
MNNCKLEDKFQILQTLGKGAFSVVYKVRRIQDSKVYALKKVSLKNLKPKEVQNALNEIRILASIKHPHIVAYKEAFIDKTTTDLCIVMENAGGGDLSTKIKECKDKRIRLPENMIIKFFYQLASSLYELHMRNIIHRDLKTANVFLTSDLKNIKLGDMNVSKIVKNIFAYTQTGTPYYASPEVWRDEPYSIKTDVWSLGCVIYELCMLRPPFNATDMDGLFDKVQKCSVDPFDSFYSKGLRDAISKLMTLDPHQRPNCEKILNFPIFNNLKVLLDDNSIGPGSNENLVFMTNELIETIKPGNDFFDLEGKLPKPQYSREYVEIADRNHGNFIDRKLDKKVSTVKNISVERNRYARKEVEVQRSNADSRDIYNSQLMTKSKRRSDSAKEVKVITKKTTANAPIENKSKIHLEKSNVISRDDGRLPEKKNGERRVVSGKSQVVVQESTPCFTKDQQKVPHLPDNKPRTNKSPNSVKIKENYRRASPMALMNKNPTQESQVISVVSNIGSYQQQGFNLTSEIGSIDSRSRSEIHPLNHELEVQNLQKKIRHVLSREADQKQSPQEKVRQAYNPAPSPVDKHSFDLLKPSMQPSQQLLVNKKSVSIFQRPAITDQCSEGKANDQNVKKALKERRRVNSITNRQGENPTSVSKISERSLNPNVQSSIDNLNSKLLKSIKTYGDVNSDARKGVNNETCLPHLNEALGRQQSNKITQSNTRKSNDRMQRPSTKKSSALNIQPNPEIVDYLAKFRIKSSKETHQRLLDSNMQGMHKSNLIHRKINYANMNLMAPESNSIDTSGRNIRSMINNFSIGAKAKPVLESDVPPAKAPLFENSNRILQKVGSLYVVGANSMLNKSKKSIVNIPDIKIGNNSHLFKKQLRPTEVKDVSLQRLEHLPIVGQRRSSKSNEPRNPTSKFDSNPANIGCMINDLIVESKLKGITQKRALSAGVFKKPELLLQNNRILSSHVNNHHQLNSGKFVLKKKSKEMSENPSAPLASGHHGSQLNMEQFVKFIKHQYGKNPREGGELASSSIQTKSRPK